MTDEQVYVQIVKDATGECATQMGPMSRRQAEKVQRGAEINLNHDEWSVLITTTRMEVKK